jgi:hypothetical protein
MKNISISIIASVIATLVVFLFQWIRNNIVSKRKFKKFEGEYQGFTYDSENPDSDDYNKYHQNESKAKITYKSVNRLYIESTWRSKTWRGDIYMKNNNVGDVSWKYNGEDQKIGSKEISFWNEDDKKIVYLKERFDEKYGRELLIKK